MSRRLLVPLMVLLATMAGLLGCGAWNRGEARQRLTLTERELRLPWPLRHATVEDEEGQLRLAIEWQRRDGPLDERNWLTEDKLKAIGFDLSIPAGNPDAERHYQRALPKLAWVVLEYDGPAWQEIDRRRRLRASDVTVRAVVGMSRLVPIDAGPDREALMLRYANARTLIVPAVFQVSYLSPTTTGGPLVYGQVQSLVTTEVTVPRRVRAELADFRDRALDPDSTPPGPRFEVDVAVGRLGFPWVIDLRRTP
jgi:hypothetical protein